MNLLLLAITLAQGAPAAKGGESVVFSFRNSAYVHRYTKGDLHEFTPKGKPSLSDWVEMVTINDYPTVKSGENLAQAANAVLDSYNGAKAIVVRTNSIPRTSQKEAEHFIAALFPTPKYVEAAFARLLLADGKGHSIVYSRRFYGKKATDEVKTWLKSQGEACEKALMALPLPKH